MIVGRLDRIVRSAPRRTPSSAPSTSTLITSIPEWVMMLSKRFIGTRISMLESGASGLASELKPESFLFTKNETSLSQSPAAHSWTSIVGNFLRSARALSGIASTEISLAGRARRKTSAVTDPMCAPTSIKHLSLGQRRATKSNATRSLAKSPSVSGVPALWTARLQYRRAAADLPRAVPTKRARRMVRLPFTASCSCRDQTTTRSWLPSPVSEAA
jgi:hypothetical protein